MDVDRKVEPCNLGVLVFLFYASLFCIYLSIFNIEYIIANIWQTLIILFLEEEFPLKKYQLEKTLFE